MRSVRAGAGGGPGRIRPVALALGLAGAAVLASGGPAVAGAHPAVSGTISTIAGGVGGPAAGTKVALQAACGVGYGDGQLYIGDETTVRNLNHISGQLTTPAGNNDPVGVGIGGLAKAASPNVCDVAADPHGNLLMADPQDSIVEAVARASGTFYGQAMTAGHIYAVAGDGDNCEYSGEGLPATDSGVCPDDVTTDSAGDLFISDSYNERVRMVPAASGTCYGIAMTAGDMYTVAGDGTTGFSGDGGLATEAKLDGPTGVAVDRSGNLVIVDSLNLRVRVVAASTGEFYGQAMTAGHIYTVAGDGTKGFSGNGIAATSAALSPVDVAVDGVGNLVLADGTDRIRVVAARKGTFYGKAMTKGNVYTVAGDGTAGYSGDGGAATAAKLDDPTSVTVDGEGNLVVADQNNLRVRVVAASTSRFYTKNMTRGDIYTVAGNGTKVSGNTGPAVKAELGGPQAVSVDAAGNVLISDYGHNQVRVLAENTGTYYGQKMTKGDIYRVAGGGTQKASGVPATSAKLTVWDAVPDQAGNLIVTDPGYQHIYVVAAKTGTFYGQAMTAGNIYPIAGTGQYGFSGDGGPALQAKLYYPAGVAVDSHGNVVFSDEFNSRIRVVAESTGTFYGQAMTAGDIYTVAGDGTYGESGDGGPASAADLSHPQGLAIDSAGNVIIADTPNGRIRVVATSTGEFYGQAMTAGDIYSVAGGGHILGDGGPAVQAMLTNPGGVAVDSAGNLVIADSGDQRIRVVATSTGEFYGQAMTAGDIYTVAGTGTAGYSGDGGPATGARLTAPGGVAVTAAGDLLIADSDANRIREVTVP